MLKEIIEKALKLPNTKRGERSLKFLPLKNYGQGKTKKSFLADNLIELIEDGKISFVKHGDNLFICAAEDLILTLRKSVDNYILTITEGDKFLVKLSDSDDDYDYLSKRRPIIDIYDIITTGKYRGVPTPHFLRSGRDYLEQMSDDVLFARDR